MSGSPSESVADPAASAAAGQAHISDCNLNEYASGLCYIAVLGAQFGLCETSMATQVLPAAASP